MYDLKGAIVIEFKTVIYSDKKSENMKRAVGRLIRYDLREKGLLIMRKK